MKSKILLFASILALSLAGCDGNKNKPENKPENKPKNKPKNKP